MRLPLFVPNNFRIIAHRGASGYAPENTLAAFRLADRMGIKEVELDVWFSRDNHIVICHDGSLDRYGYPGLHVSSLDLADLLHLDMGSWFSPYLFSGEKILTLEALFTLFRDRFVYHLEIKDPASGLARKLLETVIAHQLLDRVIITSKHVSSLNKAKDVSPLVRTGWIVPKGDFIMENISQVDCRGFFQLCPSAAETDRDIVEAGRDLCDEVRAYGVHSIDLALKAIDSGCDGFTINWPDWFVHKQS